MTQKKISRRDAIKLLGAATGAAMLANLPSKWKTPELASGVLPAHAQTSGIVFTGLCGETTFIEPDSTSLVFSITIDPPLSGVLMRWDIIFNNAEYDDPASPTAGTVVTINGVATLNTDLIHSTFGEGSVTVRWGFNDPAQGQFPACIQENFWGVV